MTASVLNHHMYSPVSHIFNIVLFLMARSKKDIRKNDVNIPGHFVGPTDNVTIICNKI